MGGGCRRGRGRARLPIGASTQATPPFPGAASAPKLPEGLDGLKPPALPNFKAPSLESLKGQPPQVRAPQLAAPAVPDFKSPSLEALKEKLR